MELLITICDILACITTVVGLYLTSRSYKWWILYTSSNIFFVVVTIYKHLPALTIMGIVLFGVGIKNYIVERKKTNG